MCVVILVCLMCVLIHCECGVCGCCSNVRLVNDFIAAVAVVTVAAFAVRELLPRQVVRVVVVQVGKLVLAWLLLLLLLSQTAVSHCSCVVVRRR